MAIVKPFQCVRPNKEEASLVAALPYDVYNRKEACEITAENPKSFLNIDRPETQFSQDIDIYDDRVYEKAAALLKDWMKDGTFELDGTKAYYIYELIMEGRSQTGIVACSSIDDYVNGVIKKHENTGRKRNWTESATWIPQMPRLVPSSWPTVPLRILTGWWKKKRRQNRSMILPQMTESVIKYGKSQIPKPWG